MVLCVVDVSRRDLRSTACRLAMHAVNINVVVRVVHAGSTGRPTTAAIITPTNEDATDVRVVAALFEASLRSSDASAGVVDRDAVYVGIMSVVFRGGAGRARRRWVPTRSV